MIEPKPWVESRTLWVNLLSLVAAVLMAVVHHEWVAAHPQIAAGLASAQAIVNLVLRVVTSQPLGPIAPTVEEPRP